MQKQGKAKSIDTGNLAGGPDEKNVGDESEEESKNEQGVRAEFLIDIDDQEETADKSDKGSAEGVLAEGV